jgi:hypothetical protein
VLMRCGPVALRQLRIAGLINLTSMFCIEKHMNIVCGAENTRSQSLARIPD